MPWMVATGDDDGTVKVSLSGRSTSNTLV